VIVTPSFANTVVDFERQRRVARLQKDGDDASRVALRLLYAAVYGPAHPYARARLSGADVLPNVSRDELVRVWKRVVDPADATLVVAGDVDPAALAARVESLFGAWKHDPSHAPPPDLPPPTPGPVRLVVVDRPGAVQATIAYGATTGPASSSSHVARAIVHEMLGGMSSSALSQTLRDELGATAFGAGFYAWKRGPGIAYWEGSVDRDRTADVLRALDARVRELHERGPAQRELDDAKERFARSLAEGFETVGGMVEYVSQLPTYGLPLDEFATREARARAVTAGAVRAAAPAPEAMRAVIVGDLPALRAQLASLGWGLIEEHDASGTLLRTVTR
jgi:zinc protease